MQVTAEKQEALRLNEAMLQEHEELQAFVAQETSRHQNAEVKTIIGNVFQLCHEFCCVCVCVCVCVSQSKPYSRYHMQTMYVCLQTLHLL